MEQSELNKKIYKRYIEILNTQNFDALPEVTNTEKYREICVGFTPGWVNMTEAIISLKKVLKGIPNLHAEIEDCIAEDNKVYARLKVRELKWATFLECLQQKIATKHKCLTMRLSRMGKL